MLWKSDGSVLEMSTFSDQNGRPASFPMQSVAPSDPRLRNSSTTGDQTKVCRNYVWGICNKHGQCKFRHECSAEEMKTIIKFCHDHQNTGCLRADCTYLHTSIEEQNLFLASGTLPMVLLERHAAMNAASAAAVSGSSGSENSPALYVAQPPPPPPPPISVTAPPPPPPPQVATVMPPPPPPPPTEPSNIHTAPPPPIYTAPPPHPPPSFTINQPPPRLPPIFDASRPPPPLPAGIRNGPTKRNIENTCEAGPSKQRKPDEVKVADNLCQMCIQRELSIKFCAEELEKLRTQREYKKLLYKTKTDEAENLKAMMRLLLPAEISLAVEEYIDVNNGVHSPLSLSVSQLMSRLIEKRTDYSSNVMESMQQSSSMRELCIGYLLNSSTSTPERSPSLELRPSEMLSADVIRSGAAGLGGNGFSRHVPAPTRPVYASTPSAPRGFPGVAAPAPPPYPPPYQPAVPPPSVRPAFPPFPPHALPQVPAPTPAAYSGAGRAPAPALPPAVAPAGSAPAPPASRGVANGHAYGSFMMTGYHSPHYYPPAQ